MTWSYSGYPDADSIDEVRFLIGDTDISDQLLSNEEIDYLLTTWLKLQGSVFYVAAVACETIAARFAREATYSADGVSVSLSELQAKYKTQAQTLREQHNELLVGGIPDAGGVDVGEEQDPRIAPFVFGTGMNDNLEAGRQEFGNRSSAEYIAEINPGV